MWACLGETKTNPGVRVRDKDYRTILKKKRQNTLAQNEDTFSKGQEAWRSSFVSRAGGPEAPEWLPVPSRHHHQRAPPQTGGLEAPEWLPVAAGTTTSAWIRLPASKQGPGTPLTCGASPIPVTRQVMKQVLIYLRSESHRVYPLIQSPDSQKLGRISKGN